MNNTNDLTETGIALPQPCSGFAVVGRHASLGFTPVTNPLLAPGFRFQEIWIFGQPKTPMEIELWQAVAPIVCWVPYGMLHRIPNVLAHPDLRAASEAPKAKNQPGSPENQGAAPCSALDVFEFAIELCDLRKSASRTVGWNAACDDLAVFLKAARERLTANLSLREYATTQNSVLCHSHENTPQPENQ